MFLKQRKYHDNQARTLAQTHIGRIHPDDRESAYVTFYSVLSELRTMHHVDVYVTGSNSRLLMSDVATVFRGRGQSIQITPLSFSEFLPLRKGCETQEIFNEYLTFGGLPKCALAASDAERKAYLDDLYRTIYLRDIIERGKIKEPAILELFNLKHAYPANTKCGNTKLTLSSTRQTNASISNLRTQFPTPKNVPKRHFPFATSTTISVKW